MMVTVSADPTQRLALGSAVPIRSVPLPAWTYLPQAERPRTAPAEAADALLMLAGHAGELRAMIRHAPGATAVLPRLTDWAIARAASAEGTGWSGERSTEPVGDTPCDSASACWHASLADWSAVTGLAPASRRAPAWIGPSIRLAGGGSTVPPPAPMLRDAIAAWQRGIDASATAADPEVVRGALDAAWTMWTLHFLQPVEHSNGLVARLAAGRVFAARACMPGMPVVPADGASALRTDDSAGLAASYDTWVRMTVSTLAADASRVIDGLGRALAGRATLLESASSMRAPRHPTMLAHAFVMRPRMTMQEAARAMGISFRAAQAVMDKFLESGLVREDTGRRRDRIYVCDTVMFGGQPQP